MQDDPWWSELLGVPAMVFVLALVALVKGLITENIGFTIVGAVASFGLFVFVGLAMATANRE
jgi:hypothetical protein